MRDDGSAEEVEAAVLGKQPGLGEPCVFSRFSLKSTYTSTQEEGKKKVDLLFTNNGDLIGKYGSGRHIGLTGWRRRWFWPDCLGTRLSEAVMLILT